MGLAAIFMCSGLLGLAGFLLFLPDTVMLLGASAGVSGLMGAFLVLFLSQPMRVWLSYLLIFNRVVLIPSYWVLLGVFILSDVAGSVDQGGGVAHLAHLIGLVAGIAIGLFFKFKQPLPEDVLYPDEIYYLDAIDRNPKSTEILGISEKILAWNPNNRRAMYAYLRAVMRESRSDERPVSQQLTSFLAISARRKEWDQGLKVLSWVPVSAPLSDLVERLSVQNRIHYANKALQKGEWLLAVRLFDSILYKRPDAEMRRQIMSSIKNIFKHVQEQNGQELSLKQLRLHTDLQKQLMAA